jgi:hypothetical protein
MNILSVIRLFVPEGEARINDEDEFGTKIRISFKITFRIKSLQERSDNNVDV